MYRLVPRAGGMCPPSIAGPRNVHDGAGTVAHGRDASAARGYAVIAAIASALAAAA